MRRFILVANRSVSAVMLLDGAQETGESWEMLLRFSCCCSAVFPRAVAWVRARWGKLGVFAE